MQLVLEATGGRAAASDLTRNYRHFCECLSHSRFLPRAAMVSTFTDQTFFLIEDFPLQEVVRARRSSLSDEPS